MGGNTSVPVLFIGSTAGEHIPVFALGNLVLTSFLCVSSDPVTPLGGSVDPISQMHAS